MTNNDQAWDKIFDKLKIVESLKHKPFYKISAKQINDIGNREARLMAKFDTKESLPKLFKEAELNINATSNGSYIIFKDPSNQSFVQLPDYKSITPVKIKPAIDFDLDTLAFNPKMSESNAIDYAHHAKVLATYSGEGDLKLTSRGRFFSDSFKFNLGNIGDIGVQGVQIEVDAAYEGLKQFLIIEAKSSTRASFNIRQLYYPFRHFQNKTNKHIRTILLSFSNGIYYFTELALSSNYYEYKIISTQAYEIEVKEKSHKIFSLNDILFQETFTPTDVTAPQADDLNKIVDLTSFLSISSADKFNIAHYFEFDERQGDYYANAGRYIGLIEKEDGLFKVSKEGRQLASITNRDNRNYFLTKLILRTKLFNDLVKLYYKQNNKLEDIQIVSRLQQEGLTGATPERRMNTVKSWINWIELNLKK